MYRRKHHVRRNDVILPTGLAIAARSLTLKSYISFPPATPEIRITRKARFTTYNVCAFPFVPRTMARWGVTDQRASVSGVTEDSPFCIRAPVVLSHTCALMRAWIIMRELTIRGKKIVRSVEMSEMMNIMRIQDCQISTTGLRNVQKFVIHSITFRLCLSISFIVQLLFYC